MRPELENIERIEQYLEGKLQGSDLTSFEEQLATDSELQEAVEWQQNITERIAHQGLVELIEQTHQQHVGATTSGAGTSMSFPTKLFLASAAVVVVAVSVWWYVTEPESATPQFTEETTLMPEEEAEAVEPNEKDFDLSSLVEVYPQHIEQQAIQLEPNRHSFVAEEGAEIRDDRSGSIIRIPANSLVDQHGNPVTGKVDLTYQEYRDQADIALSNIPMTYTDDNDETYRFNSAGMFEVRAYQHGAPLEVKQGANLSIDFQMTEDVADNGFYQLEDNTKKWKYVEPILDNEAYKRKMAVPTEHDEDVRKSATDQLTNTVTAEAEVPDQVKDFFPYTSGSSLSLEGNSPNPFRLPLWMKWKYDCERGPQQCIKQVLQYGEDHATTDDEVVFAKPFEGDLLPFADRYKDDRYAGTEKIDPEKHGIWPIELDLEEDSRKGRIAFKIKDRDGKNLELRVFKRVRWIYKPDKDFDLNSTELARSWKDVRIAWGGEEGFDSPLNVSSFLIILKGENRFLRLPVRIDHQRKIDKDRISLRNGKMMKEYNKVLLDREEAFNRLLKELPAKYKEEQEARLERFYQLSLLFVDTNEITMEKEEWLEHFRSNKDEMAERYKKLLKEYTEAESQEKWWASQVNAQEAKMWAMDQELFEQVDRIDAEILRTERIRKTNAMDVRDPRKSQKPKPPTYLWGGGDAGHTYPELVRTLKIPGFGVYNCDAIGRVRNPVHILASYEDVEGNPIKYGQVLSLIDLRANGAFSFDPKRFTCRRNGKQSALLLITFDKKIYFLDQEGLMAAGINQTGRYNFVMKDLTDEIKGSDDLRKYLGLASN